MSEAAGFLSLCFLVASFSAQGLPSHPHIKGLAFVRLDVSDISKSRRFYQETLQLGNHFNDCLGPRSVCFRLNPSQTIELVQPDTLPDKSQLAEVGFWTDDLDGMRRYLKSEGYASVGEIHSGYDERKRFELRDPENHSIAFVSPPLPSTFFSWSSQVSRRMIHAGFVVNSMAAENHFYRELLGFRLYWEGGFKDDGLDWYEIQVPDGDNWIEYMLNIPANADHDELGVQNHFSLGVSDIHAAAEQLHKNGLQKFDGPEIGRDGKWSLDAYDPDGTRIEFMEFSPAQKPCCHPYTAEHPQP